MIDAQWIVTPTRLTTSRIWLLSVSRLRDFGTEIQCLWSQGCYILLHECTKYWLCIRNWNQFPKLSSLFSRRYMLLFYIPIFNNREHKEQVWAEIRCSIYILIAMNQISEWDKQIIYCFLWVFVLTSLHYICVYKVMRTQTCGRSLGHPFRYFSLTKHKMRHSINSFYFYFYP